MMHINRTHVFLAIVLFLGTTAFPLLTSNLNESELNKIKNNKEIGTGEDVDITILNWPDKTSYDLEIDVEDGHSITDLEMKMTPLHNMGLDVI